MGLNLSFEEISIMSKYSYKPKVKKAVNLSAFNLLITEKNKLVKVSQINYSQLKMQSYFLPNKMTVKQCNLLFSLRARMVQVRINYKNSYTELFCPVCKDPTKQDNQQHLLFCKKLMENENLVIKTKIEYTDILKSNVQ